MMTFTREQLATLRKVAQQATQGEWRAFISPGTDTYAVHTPEDERCGDIINWPGFDGRKNAKNNAEFVAVFNPKVVLALLDVLDASLEAEPVAWTDEEELRDVERHGFGEIFQCPPDKYADLRRVIPLYREPPAVPAVLERLRAIVSDPRALPRRKEWVSGQQYSYVLLENVEAMVDEACRTAMLQGKGGA